MKSPGRLRALCPGQPAEPAAAGVLGGQGQPRRAPTPGTSRGTASGKVPGPGAAERPGAPRPQPGPPASSSPVGGQQRLVDQHDEEGAGPVEERRQQLGHPGGQPRGGGVPVRALGLAARRHVPRPPAALPPAPPQFRPRPRPARERARPRQEGLRPPRVRAPGERPAAAARTVRAAGAGARRSPGLSTSFPLADGRNGVGRVEQTFRLPSCAPGAAV